MSLESASFINQLVPSNPDGFDPKGQGDDHLRLIKNVLKTTFPNINAAVTVTPAELNSLAGGLLQFKPGMIILWNGAIADIPAGWALCNGTAGTPNLTDRFVVGAGGSYAVGAAGGATQHGHGITINGTALTVEQLPPHVHGTLNGGGAFITNGSGAGNTVGGSNIGGVPTTGSTGSGQTHTHSASIALTDSRPPYFALAYIMKT